MPVCQKVTRAEKALWEWRIKRNALGMIINLKHGGLSCIYGGNLGPRANMGGFVVMVDTDGLYTPGKGCVRSRGTVCASL